MSASYGWVPAPRVPPQVSGGFGVGLADILTRRLFIDPGPNLPSNRHQLNGCAVDRGLLDWLRGVAAAGNGEIAADAESLIAAIREHDVIVLRVER